MAPTEADRIARAKWEGAMEEKIGESVEHRIRIDKRLEELEKTLGEIQVALGTVKTKMAFYSAIGALLGGGLVTFLYAFAQKAIG